MFQSWRLKLRETEEALKCGRLDEAREMLVRANLDQYRPGKRLAGKIADRMGERARQYAQGVNLAAAFKDLEAAAELTGETSEILQARQAIVAAGVREAEARLGKGDVAGAMALLEQSEEGGGKSHPELGQLREVALRIQSAQKLARRGRFTDAESQLQSALNLRAEMGILSERIHEIQKQGELSRGLNEQLHRALADSQWSDAVALAEQLLQLAPESRLARDARQRAWSKVGARVVDSHRLERTQEYRPGSHPGSCSDYKAGERFVLWVDGVGGYLVCLSDEVMIGQSTPGNRVDIPILGDISHHHAKIHRAGEGYVIEPFHRTRLNGAAIQEKTVLKDGDEFELGTGVRFRFHRPHALSASARLEFLSRHKTTPFADGILLMAESCVLGPKLQNHVVCRDWENDVVLYRKDEELYCQAMESIEIDGQLCDGRGNLQANSHVAGSDFSLSLEELDRCSTQPLR